MIARTRISILQIPVHKDAKPLSSVGSVPPRGFSNAQTAPAEWLSSSAWPETEPSKSRVVGRSEGSSADPLFQTTNLIARHLGFPPSHRIKNFFRLAGKRRIRFADRSNSSALDTVVIQIMIDE